MQKWSLGARLPIALGLAAALSAAAPAAAQVPPVTTCNGGTLAPGTGGDLEVTGVCNVPAGTYRYRYVNVWGGGALRFTDAVIDFWASGILVESDGSLTAGTSAAPIGTAGGRLTIHLYGGPTTDTNPPIACKSSPTCGVDPDVWNGKVTTPVSLPGGVTDYFYGYGMNHGNDHAHLGMFGAKVLAVSYKGTLNLFGKKGATYRSALPSDSGTSWVRLAKSVQKGARLLLVDRPVDWQAGDSIVLTTTDYLPGHSEKLTVLSVASNGKTVNVKEPIQYAHNGSAYDLSSVPTRLDFESKTAETRAAVGLLTRSIRIVSEGAALDQPFPSGPGQYFGGHTMFRQGFASVQVQGVEFFQLGQGGSKGHYPVHFHLARRTPANTFVMDSSVHDSMTRWITIHGTHDVTLARNVGYLSIGHGYYLEDGTEINNKLLSNLGVFARAAVKNPQNPRQVPGILASPDRPGAEMVPYHSDYDHPSVFWIMNGWNDFQYNMAAGAGTCGSCYWLLPGANSGPSRNQKWTSYASMQSNFGRAAMTPLKSFIGNSCTTAMNSFNTIGNTTACLGVGGPGDGFAHLDPVPNPNAPASNAANAADYYPVVDPGGGRFATRCDGDDADCSTVPKCASGGAAEQNCMITALDGYTSSFHWTETNFAAIWLRPQWYLMVNSFLSDVQNGGLTFVTGGGYTRSDAINGHWALVRKSAFVGATQPANPFASAAGPFNPQGLACDNAAANYCLSVAEGISVQISNFGVNQRLFNIYDGPAYQDSNAYLDIKTTPIPDCMPGSVEHTCGSSKYSYGRALGMPQNAQAQCYLPNAAIGWKQPNGFFYPPAFHSDNLYFEDVDIRHFVIEPLFLPGTFKTDSAAAQKRYCTWNSAMFTGFTDIDRQTELSDDDGSLTGIVDSISVNEDDFFDAPIEGIECASDGTAKTSPYDYVSTVIYPGCATNGSCNQATEWSTPCSNETCYGVPLYRQYLTGDEVAAGAKPSIRMMGQSISQRSTLTANNASYYVDTTVGLAKQKAAGASWVNVFQAGKTYYLFPLYAKSSTKQVYQMYVGKDPTWNPATSVGMTRAVIDALPLAFTPGAWPSTWTRTYDSGTGILTVSMDMSFPDFATAYAAAAPGLCRPFSFCGWNAQTSKCQCALPQSDPLYGECIEKNAAGDDAICSFAVKDFACPSGGCFGVSVTLSSKFATDPAVDPRPAAVCYPRDANWNVTPKDASSDLAGSCYDPPMEPADFCKTRVRAPR